LQDGVEDSSSPLLVFGYSDHLGRAHAAMSSMTREFPRSCQAAVALPNGHGLKGGPHFSCVKAGIRDVV